MEDFCTPAQVLLLKLGAPTGMIMISCTSTGIAALRSIYDIIIGTGTCYHLHRG